MPLLYVLPITIYTWALKRHDHNTCKTFFLHEVVRPRKIPLLVLIERLQTSRIAKYAAAILRKCLQNDLLEVVSPKAQKLKKCFTQHDNIIIDHRALFTTELFFQVALHVSWTSLLRSERQLLTTGGMPMNARIEILQGPDTNKQVIELYSENGLDRPFFCTFATPWSGNVIRILNTGPMEYPLTASVVPVAP
jgi:hypothetical protein